MCFKIALLLCSFLLALEACRLQSKDLVGSINPVDNALSLSGSGFAASTAFDINGAGFSALVDVSSGAASGCIFSAGTPNTPSYIEMRLVTLATSTTMHAIQIVIGNQTAQTFGVVKKNTWQQLAFTVSNNKVGGANGYFDLQVYVAGQAYPTNARLTLNGVPAGARTLSIGQCASDNSGFSGMIDNLRLFSMVMSMQDVQNQNIQFFPMPSTEGLIVYYHFNDLSSTNSKTVGQVGGSANSQIPAALQNGASFILRQGTAGDRIGALCVKQGISVKNGQPPFFGQQGGGYTQTILCNPSGATSLVFNQQFASNGMVTSLSIRTGVLHYWRISSPGLKVEHRTWGGWTVMPRGADFLVQDKTTIKFQDDSIEFQAGAYGYIKITEDQQTHNLNYQVGVNPSQCTQPTDYSTGYCDFHATQLSTFEFSSFPVPEMPMGVLAQGQGVLGQATILACPPPSQVYRPDLLPPPAPVPLDPVVQQPGPNPCTAIPAARLSLFTAACQANFPDASARQQCMADSCIANNPYEPPKITCETQKLIRLTDPTFQIDPSCGTNCPNGCSSRGTCVNGVCQCPPNWVGPDCSRPSQFSCITSSSTAGQVILRPLFVRSNGVVVAASTFLGNLQLYTAPYRVVDSTMIYVARTMTSGTDPTPVYHLVFANNNGNGNAAGGQMTATITGNGISLSGATVTPLVVSADPISAQLTGNTYTITSSWRFSGYSVFVLSGLSSLNFTVSVQSSGGLSQVLVGSAHLLETDANLATFKQPIGSSININGGTCTDICANITNCAACAAVPSCGWCVDSGRCVPGDRSGPWTYGICQNWRYTFDTTKSRRLTQQLAFPVNPKYTDVIVTTADSLDLPIEIVVAPRAPSGMTWDFVYLAQWNNNIQKMFTTYIDSIIGTLAGYPNLGVGFVSLRSGGFDLIRDLSNPRDNFYIPQAVRAANSVAVGPVSVLASLNSLPIAWRPSSSRLVLVITDQTFIAGEVDVNAVRRSLTQNGVIPIFLVPQTLAAAYQSLVSNGLQYGMVMTGVPFSVQNSIPQVSVRALQMASGYASTFYTNAGIIDTAAWSANAQSWQLFGLRPSIFARFLIPVAGLANPNATAVTQLQIPGYGSAQVQNILSDRPVAFPTNTTYSVIAGKGVLVTLNGRSLRDLFQTIPKVVTLPTKGTLNMVKPITANGVNTGQFVPGDPIPVGGVTDDLLNRIFYVANPNTGGQTDTFQLSVTDTCSDSQVVTFTINIIQNNRPPETSMLPVTLNENTPAIITLEAYDPNGNLLNVFLTDVIHQLDQEGKRLYGNAGVLYQFSPSITASRPAANDTNAAAFIMRAGDKVTDGQGRIVYWPPLYTNSYADPQLTPWFLIHPCFTYQATQVNTPEKFSSTPTDVAIDVFSVNDPPFVWADPSSAYPINLPQYGWNTPSGVCWSEGADCTWPEDFGQVFPWNIPYKYLYVGGDSIEKSNLDIVITSLQCDPLANLSFDLTGDRAIQVGDKIQQRPPGVLAPGIRFRPGPDRNNENGGFGSFYCKIGYATIDKTGAQSVNNRVITISITPVPDPPRLRQQTNLVTGVEMIPKEFLIDAMSPDNSAFDTVITDCSTPGRGKFEICMDQACTQSLRQVFTCDQVKASNGGITLNKRRTSKRQALVPGAQGYLGIFTSGPLARPSEGLNYQRLTVAFVTQQSSGSTPSNTFEIYFNVIKLNQAPVITLNNDTSSTVAVTLVNDDKFLPSLSVSDIDIAQGNLDFDISFTPNDGSSIAFVDRSTNQPVQTNAITATSANSAHLSGKLLTVNSLLGGFVFTPKKKDLTYTFTFVANDNGFSGQCPFGADGKPLPYDTLMYSATSTCPRTATTQVAVSYVNPSQLKTIALASSGAAVLVLGIIGAALAVRAFNSKAENAGYKPWDVFHESDAVLSNPLYEEAALGGASGIYEAKSNKDLLGSSSSESPQYIGMDKPSV